jgi:hypothetical protein
LLEDLLAVRTKEMKSIVLTIQSNQDQLIRSEFRKPFAVSGGPGTGKTIVGLHRVSNILYQLNQTSSAATALVIGPTDRFVAYIQNILPSLGKTSVKHQSIPDLCLSGLSEKRRQKISIEIVEHPSIQIVKSSVAIGLIIRKLIVNTIKPVNLAEKILDLSHTSIQTSGDNYYFGKNAKISRGCLHYDTKKTQDIFNACRNSDGEFYFGETSNDNLQNYKNNLSRTTYNPYYQEVVKKLNDFIN